MKKTILMVSLLIIFKVISFGQPTKQPYKVICTYEFTYTPDSTKSMDKRFEEMVLCLNSENSIFESRSQYLMDSSKGKIFKSSNFKFKINKKGCNDISVVDYIPRNFYNYKELKPLLWKISPDTSMITGYVCQKATTSLGGRQWTAWFSTDIPYSDGPYKFCGLPGLIMQVNDNQHYFSFKLISLINKEQNITVADNNIKLIPTTKAKFFKTLEEYRENPLPFMGQGITFTAGKDAILQNVKKHINENNNSIELNVN